MKRTLLILLPLAGCHLLFSHRGADDGSPSVPGLGDARSDSPRGEDLTVRPFDALAGDLAAHDRAAGEQRVRDSASADSAAKPDKLASDSAPGPLFSDDFSSDLGYTKDGTGSWTVGGGVLTQSTCTSQVTKVKVPGKLWGDVRARVRVRADGICAGTASAVAAVLLRVGGISNCTGNLYYWCNLDYRFNALRTGAHKGVCMTGTWGSTPTPPQQIGTWYDLEFTVVGGKLTCKASGGNFPSQVVATWTDPAPIAAGSVGLYTGFLKATFDDLRVEAP